MFVFRINVFYLHSDTYPQFSSVNTSTCPGNTITYTCTINSSAYSISTIWSGSAFQCNSTVSRPANQITLTQKSGGSVIPIAGGSCGSLSAVTTNVTSSCYTSVLTIPAVQALNGTTINCTDGVTGTIVGSDIVRITSELRSLHPSLVHLIHAPSHYFILLSPPQPLSSSPSSSTSIYLCLILMNLAQFLSDDVVY